MIGTRIRDAVNPVPMAHPAWPWAGQERPARAHGMANLVGVGVWLYLGSWIIHYDSLWFTMTSTNQTQTVFKVH